MARFVGLKWIAKSSTWDILVRERSAAATVAKLDLYMALNPPTFPPTTLGLARVPPGVHVEQFVSTLPAPGHAFDDCPLCRAGGPTIH